MNKKKDNIITLDKFIHEALYNTEYGYYMKQNPFGKNGDFITAPNISILFSEMIAIWIMSFWKNLKCPKKFNLTELGAGNGEMIFQIIKTLQKFPSFIKACRITILEKSTKLKKLQRIKLKKYNVKWLENLDQIDNIPTIFVANEFFDALPIKQFIKKKNKWYERNIKFSNTNVPKFLDVLTDIKKIEKKINFKISYKQNFIEYSPLCIEYLNKISKRISSYKGGILIIDYGYWENKMKDSLKSIRSHKFNNILENFSNADISYDINFKLFEKIFHKLNLKIIGLSNQRDFLINMGILDRAENISKKLPFSKKVDIFFRLNKLIDKNSMGEIFKVIVATDKSTNFRTGFVN